MLGKDPHDGMPCRRIDWILTTKGEWNVLIDGRKKYILKSAIHGAFIGLMTTSIKNNQYYWSQAIEVKAKHCTNDIGEYINMQGGKQTQPSRYNTSTCSVFRCDECTQSKVKGIYRCLHTVLWQIYQKILGPHTIHPIMLRPI